MTKLIKFVIALFCNINSYYYFRQFVFGIAMSFLAILATGGLNSQIIIPAIICTFLYPYSRFAYEIIIDFLIGFIRGDNVITGNNIIENDKVIIVNKIVLSDDNTEMMADIIWLLFKVIGMALCFCLSPFLAPIGLLLLYLQKRSTEKAGTEIE